MPAALIAILAVAIFAVLLLAVAAWDYFGPHPKMPGQIPYAEIAARLDTDRTQP